MLQCRRNEMPDYELFYEEVRYYDASRSWETTVSKSIPIKNVADDQEAIIAVKTIISRPSDDLLVVKKVPIKLLRLVRVYSWK